MGTHQSTTHHHREKWAVSKARAQSYTANTQNQESRVAITNIMHILILSCLQYNVTLVTTDCGWWWCMEAVKWRWLAALLHWCQVSSSAGCLLWLKESLVIPSQAGAGWRCPVVPCAAPVRLPCKLLGGSLLSSIPGSAMRRCWSSPIVTLHALIFQFSENALY